jgi:hypothetical protein
MECLVCSNGGYAQSFSAARFGVFKKGMLNVFFLGKEKCTV